MSSKFTAAAKTLWDSIPQQIQKQLLDNVWCVSCSGISTIVEFEGQVEEGDLVLTGSCKKCGSEVVRSIESE